MISSESSARRIGAKHVHEPIGDGSAAISRHSLGGVRAKFRGIGLVTLAMLVALALASSARAQAPVSLGTAESFAVLAGSTVTNTGPTVVSGDLGVSPGNAVVGFPPGIVINGDIHAGDAVAEQAQSDLTAAYNDVAGRPCDQNLSGQDLGGLTLTPGVYCFGSSAQLTGPLTLDAQGDPDAVFIFQIGTTLTTASDSSVVLIGEADACNIFWQVGSSATLGTATDFAGNILALQSITANTAATVDGRLLARNGAVTLDSNTVRGAQCDPPQTTITSGPRDGGTTSDPTPTFEFTSDEPGSTFECSVDGGPFEPCDSPEEIGPLPDGWHTFRVRATDPEGNTDPTPARRAFRVDTTGPRVGIGGAPGDGVKGNPVRPGREGCFESDFRLRIRARDPSGIRSVTVFLDGRPIKRTTRRRFTVWIRAERLPAGRHTVQVRARDRAGNLTVKRRSFRRCRRSTDPRFTG